MTAKMSKPVVPVPPKKSTNPSRRELDTITASFLAVRILHCFNRSASTESAVQDRLKQGALPLTPARLRPTLARLVRNNLLKTKSAPHSERTYALTPKGRRLLNSATDHLELLSKSLKP